MPSACKPHRSESFKLSPHPLLIEKVRDIVGLYMNPPDHALVFCLEEKSQIQALDRRQPLLPLRPGQLERRTHDYKRHGTTSLFAALEWKTNRVIGQLHRRHRSHEFRRFLTTIEPNVPATRRSCRPGQLWHAQNGAHPEVVRQTTALSCPFHPNLRILDQPGRTLLRRNHQQAHLSRRIPKRERTGGGHPRIHRCSQRKSQTLRLDQDGRRNSGQHRPLRSAHPHRRPAIMTYVANHCDRRLVSCHRTM
jgi:hypothetical protein